MQIPLSSHQERMWFIDHFERGHVYPHPPVYHNLPLLLKVTGSLDTTAARAALQTVVDRHEILRTRIVESGATAQQRIESQLVLPWNEQALPAELETSQVLDRIIAANAAPFDLTTQPLLRATWFDGHPSWLLVTLHHLIADQATLDLLATELAATLRGETLPSPELHYADFAAWQQDLPADALEPLLLHWKWQLRGRIPPLELPTARPRVAVHTFTGARHTFTWDATTTGQLADFAQTHGTTFTAAALSAFTILLHRYARQDEIVIGTRAPNRRQPDTAPLFGPLANLVVLRHHLDGNPTFADSVKVFARHHADALEHQEMPFDDLVRAINPPKDMSRTALFDVLATCEEQPLPVLDLGPHGHLERLDLNLGHGKYDLALHLVRQADGTTAGTITFNTDLHDASFVARLATHLGRLTQAGCAAPATGIDDLPLLDAAETAQQLETFNAAATAATAPRDQTLVSLFAAQVARSPDAIALTQGDTSLTYRELDARANQLAHHLRGQDVGPDQLVAVALDRSPTLLVALLGVLKAGGAYLPIDPKHPADRIRFTLADAAVQHLVSDTAIAAQLQVPASVDQITLLDRDHAALLAQPTTPPAVADLRPAHLAYCIYTSGSTGRPKGALIEHRQVVRLLFTDPCPFDFGPADVWTLFHSACFDFSVWEMYGALLFGGRLVVVPGETTRDPSAFADLLLAERVTILNQTPSAFHQLSTELKRRDFPAHALRQVIFGGEALAPRQLSDFATAYPATALVNMFGITETTVHVTHHRVTADDIATNRPIIGRPLPTTTTLILDEHQRLVPLGVPGEICVGGEGLARGYLNREELTQQRFIPHPFLPGERLYRSGDLGRLQEDGTMLHLGRMDDQVQVRGFRVELGEIQAALLQHPDLTAAEVVARDTEHAGVELVSYLVAATPDATPSPTDLRHHLVASLPDYMVPNAFVFLAQLPLTPNGKVDRAALPAPDSDRAAAGPAYAAPVGETERFVADTFAGLLGADAATIGRHHHFFELGGHSLLAAQLIARLRDRFSTDLPLRHVFDAPTVMALAAVIDSIRQQPNLDAPTAIPRAARRSAATATLSST